MEEIKDDPSKSNLELRITETWWLKLRVQANGHTEWIDAHTVSIVTCSKQLSMPTYLWRA
jgi:hypothetical protein